MTFGLTHVAEYREESLYPGQVLSKCLCVSRAVEYRLFTPSLLFPCEQAASLPTACLTSLQAMKRADICGGKKVLVIGASGGCGLSGVQIAAAMGATVTAVCSRPNAELVKRMGAVRVIDYQVMLQTMVVQTIVMRTRLDTWTPGQLWVFVGT